MKLDITRFSSVRLSQDDEQYQKNLTALKEAGFWFDPVEQEWVKPEPLLEGEEVRLQYFGSEGVHLERDEIFTFRKMLFFLMNNGFEYDATKRPLVSAERPKLLALTQSIFHPAGDFDPQVGVGVSGFFFRRLS